MAITNGGDIPWKMISLESHFESISQDVLGDIYNQARDICPDCKTKNKQIVPALYKYFFAAWIPAEYATLRPLTHTRTRARTLLTVNFSRPKTDGGE